MIDILLVILILILVDIGFMALVHLFNGSRIPRSLSEFVHFMNPAIIVYLKDCK